MHLLSLWHNACAHLFPLCIPLYCGTADNRIYFAIKSNLGNQFPFQDFHHNFMLRIVCTMSPSTRSRFHRDLKCTCRQFSLSVLKCCLELLILSGELECKCGKSSFILMSQVLDLLKRVYWNGLELTTFKEPCIYSCLWCRYGFRKLVSPHRPDASLAFHYFAVFIQKPCLSPVTHPAWQEFYANAGSLEKTVAWEKGAMTRGLDSSNRHLVLVACRTELFASFEV